MHLYHDDCFNVFPRLEDSSIDMVCCDLPYGTTAAGWDTVIPLDKMWNELNRVVKPTGVVVLFGSEPFSTYLRMSNIKNYKYDWVWEKSKGLGFQHSKNMPLKRHENISVFSRAPIGHVSLLVEKRMPYNPQGVIYTNKTGKIRASNHSSELMGARDKQVGREYKIAENFPTSILKYNSVSNPVHPTEKPVALLEYLIKTYTEEGETVLDFTAGSCSTMEACINTKRDCICVDKEQRYFDIASDRIKNLNTLFNSELIIEDWMGGV